MTRLRRPFLSTLSVALVAALALGACGRSSTSRSVSSATEASAPTGALNAKEYALAGAILDASKSLTAYRRVCSAIATTYAPETQLTRAYRSECVAYLALATPTNGYADCVSSVPSGSTTYDSNISALTCNTRWFPQMAREDPVLDAAIHAVDAALRARGIPPVSRCGEIFALGPGVPFNLPVAERLEGRLTQLSMSLLKNQAALHRNATPRFLAEDDALGSAERRLHAAITLPNRFDRSVCRHAAD